MMTVHAQLVAVERDIMDYTTYVFKNLDKAPFGHNYIMCTRWPNWQCGPVELNDVGYLTYNEVVAGRDSWFDKETGKEVPYNYSNLVFIKFVPDKPDTSKEIIL